VFGYGSALRIDWLPGRRQTINLGVTVPILQGPMGKTRPRSHKVAVPAARAPALAPLPGPDDELALALAEMQRARDWLLASTRLLYREPGATHDAALATQRTMVASYLEAAGTTDALRPDGRSYVTELALWHRQMERALGAAARDPGFGAALAAAARTALLDSVLLPYDALFGQHRSPDNLFGFGANGRRAFDATLPPGLDTGARSRVLETWDRIVALLDGQRAARRTLEKNDGRFVWMPLQMALLPEQHDEQAEMDALLARAVGRPFRGGHRMAYVSGTQFPFVLARQLLSARRYHVLWIHDYPGRSAAGTPDSIAFGETLVYLRALTAAVRRYDSLGRLPQYFVFLDQNYYDARQSRIWMDVLERPLAARPGLGRGGEGMARQLAAWQDSLRAAVDASRRLQAEAEVRGTGWLERVVKVHVSITHPADLSFRSSHLALGAPFVPDNVARDHRKVAFMDLVPTDPMAGSAILTGVGVGENYADDTWDDRALVGSGPGLLALVQEARRLLLRNGFAEDELPEHFRGTWDLPAAPLVPNDALASAALLASNDVGFGVKGASVAQMVLLTLMPAGSVIYIPDSIWTSMLYASELVSAALRGCHVLVVAPALPNAPSAASFTMARNWDVFTRLLEVQRGLQPWFARHGGLLRVGYYARQSPLDDPVGLLDEVAAGLERAPFLGHELGAVPGAFRRAAQELRERPLPGGVLVRDTLRRAPRLHAKTQFLASREVWQDLLRGNVLRDVEVASLWPTLQLQQPLDSVGIPIDAMAVLDAVSAAVARLPDSTRRRSVLYFTAGSMNKDVRSMVLDGELNLVVGGPKALVGLLEFIHIFGLSRWPETQEQLAELMPAWSERDRKLGYAIRRAL
jgi:hypothetical protein